jgi:undecaprenyl-diphosphatase
LIKMSVARPRPLDGVVDAGSDAFPSGHTTTAAAVTIALLIAFPRVWAWVLAAAWIPLMAISRNYLLVHWLSDVIAGAVLGASVALVVSGITRAATSRILKEPSPDGSPITG